MAGIVNGFSDFCDELVIFCLYELSETTRVGATYRSRIDNTLEGDAKFTPKNAAAQTFLGLAQAGGSLLPTDVEADVELPATLSLAGYHELNSKWAVMADITWTEWSTLDELVIEFDVGLQPDTVEVFDWDDTFRYGVGVNYRHSDTLLWRGGIAFDESPVPSKEKRGVRIPDEDRLWLSFGAGFKPARGITVDVGYAHLFVDEAKINNTNNTGHTLVGEFDNSVAFSSGILVWALERPVALVFDEYDAGRPDVMFVIQRLLETNGKLTLLDQNRVITPHRAFRLFATANTAGLGDASGLYAGTQALNQAQLDRWHLVSELGYLPAAQP